MQLSTGIFDTQLPLEKASTNKYNEAAFDLTRRVKPSQLGKTIKCMKTLFKAHPECNDEMLEQLVKVLPIPLKVIQAPSGERFMPSAYNTVERSARIPASNVYYPELSQLSKPKLSHFDEEVLMNRFYSLYSMMYTADSSQSDYSVYFANTDDANKMIGCGMLLVQPETSNLVGRYQSTNNFMLQVDPNDTLSGSMNLITTVNVFLNTPISEYNISSKYMGYISMARDGQIKAEIGESICSPLMSMIEKNENRTIASMKTVYFPKIVFICTQMRSTMPIEDLNRNRNRSKNLLDMASQR